MPVKINSSSSDSEPEESKDSEESLGDRIAKLRSKRELNLTEMASRLREVVGTKTRYSRIKEWEEGNVIPSAETVAALAMLHPLDPQGCLKWLREGGEMPRLHVDRNERGSDVPAPGVNHARALEAIAAVNRFAVELAEILRRDPRATGAEVLEVTQKIKDSEVDGGQPEDE